MGVFVLELGHRLLELLILAVDPVMDFPIDLWLLSFHPLPLSWRRRDFTFVSFLVAGGVPEQTIYFEELVLTVIVLSILVSLAIVLPEWALVETALHSRSETGLIVRSQYLVFLFPVNCMRVAFVLTHSVHYATLMCRSMTLQLALGRH